MIFRITGAAAAAMKLLEEGRKQLEDQSRKYQLASDNLQTFHRDIGLKITQCIDAKKQYLASSQAVANAPKNVNNPNLQQVQMSNEKKFNELKEKINNDFNAASLVNGAIFEMVRRCQHYSEYIQAPHIISLYYQSSLAGNITQVSKQFSTVDFFKDMPNPRIAEVIRVAIAKPAASSLAELIRWPVDRRSMD